MLLERYFVFVLAFLDAVNVFCFNTSVYERGTSAVRLRISSILMFARCA